MDRSPTALAYQLPRVSGSTPYLEPPQEGTFGKRTLWSVRTILRPLHISNGKAVYALIACRNSPATFLRSIWGPFVPSTSRECSIRQPTICSSSTSRGAETPSPGGSADLGMVRNCSGGPVCISGNQPLPVVLLPNQGNAQHRCTCKYAFPQVSILAQTLCKIREVEEQVLLVAPYWPSRTWFPELMLLATAPRWPIPLSKELPQTRGTLWPPRPDLWKLHVWSLDGTQRF